MALPRNYTPPADLREVRLTFRQRRALWLSAQGWTADRTGRHLGITSRGVQDLLYKSTVKFGALNITHAVFLATTHGQIGPHLDCGTRKAYLRHLRHRESACTACREANRAYVDAQRKALP